MERRDARAHHFAVQNSFTQGGSGKFRPLLWQLFTGLVDLRLVASSASAAGGSGSGAAGAAAPDRTGPAPVLAGWLHQLVVADYHAACRDMGEPASAGTTASPAPTPGACPSPDTVTALRSFHGNFVADGLKPGSRFTVTAPSGSGRTVTVNGTRVTVAGSSLTALMTAHGTGVRPGELRVSFTLSAIGGRWYVSDLNLDV
jgi:hypothetical protein